MREANFKDFSSKGLSFAMSYSFLIEQLKFK